MMVLLVTLVCYFALRDYIVFVSILVSVVELLRSYFEATRSEVAVLLEKASRFVLDYEYVYVVMLLLSEQMQNEAQHQLSVRSDDECTPRGNMISKILLLILIVRDTSVHRIRSMFIMMYPVHQRDAAAGPREDIHQEIHVPPTTSRSTVIGLESSSECMMKTVFLLINHENSYWSWTSRCRWK